ncbi:hypothetical protein B0H13DRAFT_1572558, partial [Mycena leptocephala]
KLGCNFNLIAFDMRVAGKSVCSPSGKHDSWVDAADLAFCHQALKLAPMHVLVFDAISMECALRFAVLFPDLCLSLALCNVAAPKEPTCIDEIVQNLCIANDLESYEHAAMEVASSLFCPVRCFWIDDWERVMPPRRRRRIVEYANMVKNVS